MILHNTETIFILLDTTLEIRDRHKVIMLLWLSLLLLNIGLPLCVMVKSKNEMVGCDDGCSHQIVSQARNEKREASYERAELAQKL